VRSAQNFNVTHDLNNLILRKFVLGKHFKKVRDFEPRWSVSVISEDEYYDVDMLAAIVYPRFHHYN
jgi:hypothetical protein